MTLNDLMIVVAGLAVGFVAQPIRIESTRVVQTCEFFARVVTYESIYWTLVRFAFPAALGLGLVVLARRLRFGGRPSPAEWLALVMLLLLLDPVVPSDRHVSGPVVTREHTYIDVEGVPVPTKYVRSAVLVGTDPERPLGPVVLLTVALGGVLLGATWLAVRRGMPDGVLTLLLLGLAWAWLRVPPRLNPEEVVRFRYAWLAIPTSSPPPGWSAAAFEWYVEARLAVGRWFLGAWLAAIAMAAARSVFRGGVGAWCWTEWAASVLALLLAAAWAWDELVLRPWPGLAVRGTVFAASIAGVGLTAVRWTRATAASPSESLQPS
jgi:hypothetical protein